MSVNHSNPTAATSFPDHIDGNKNINIKIPITEHSFDIPEEEPFLVKYTEHNEDDCAYLSNDELAIHQLESELATLKMRINNYLEDIRMSADLELDNYTADLILSIYVHGQHMLGDVS